jgi:hypothetical protein
MEIGHAVLRDRAVVKVDGPAWRDFLQGLLTQDMLGVAPGEVRFAALLTPQGRLLVDLFVVAADGGCLLDCPAPMRDLLVERLNMYRLRAKVTVEASQLAVCAAWGSSEFGHGWARDPRLPEIGFRRYGVADAGVTATDDYDAHRLRLGVPGFADFDSDKTYPIEANFDLLNGIDFTKGCFVGQETTSRMKRRGAIKTRMAPIAFQGDAPAPGSELLAGDLRAGLALSGQPGRAMAILRLDRLGAGERRLTDERPWAPDFPPWMEAAVQGR